MHFSLSKRYLATVATAPTYFGHGFGKQFLSPGFAVFFLVCADRNAPLHQVVDWANILLTLVLLPVSSSLHHSWMAILPNTAQAATSKAPAGSIRAPAQSTNAKSSKEAAAPTAAAVLTPTDTAVVCSQCGKCSAPHQCSQCKVAKYCSRECQRTHWKKGGHKKACTPTSK
jgi:hypothetical protein